MPFRSNVAAVFASTIVLCLGPTPAFAYGEPRPSNAMDAIFSAFQTHPVVALGMSHRQQDEADFSLDLIRDPRFVKVVNDVVVECGNPLYQDAMDRYMRGEDVPLEQLQLFWRNTTQVGACDPPQHKDLVDAVREINRRLPPKRRIRVLAGDPPIDWDKIHSAADLAPFTTQRDTHFASVVCDALARHHKALLVVGAGHVLKAPITWASQSDPPAPTVTMLVEQKYPGSVYVIFPHDGFGPRNTELEPRLATWTKPALAELHGTWIGEMNAGQIFHGKLMRVGSDPSHPEEPFPGMQFEQLADAYLYLGPAASIRIVQFPREQNTPYARELERRRKLLGAGGALIAPAPAPLPR